MFSNNLFNRFKTLVHELKLSLFLKVDQISTERAAYEDLLVNWENGDCYYQIEKWEKYAIMPTHEDISDIPDIKTLILVLIIINLIANNAPSIT